MPVSYPEITKFDGLHLQANSFTVPDGALEIASNVVLSKDFKLSKRRGYYQYFSPGAGTLNNLAVYQNKLLALFGSKWSYFTDTGSTPNITGTESVLTGATVSATGTRVSRWALSNNNFYATTDNGILKLEAYNGTIYKSGVPPALDIRGAFEPENGVFAGDSAMAYRVVYGRRDANDNLLLGSPSDILSLANAKVVGVSWSRTTNVVTVTSSGHNLSTGMIVVVSNSQAGTPNVTAASYTITGTTATTFTFAETAANSSGTLDYTVTRKPRIEFSIPSEIDSTAPGWFYQIYRTTQTAGSTVTPSPDFKLVDEQRVTSGQISAGMVFYEDEIDEVLLGAELYTNPNSREGEAQANDKPPLSDDIALFKDHMFFAKCNTRGAIDLQLVEPSAITSSSFVEIKVGATTRRYVARSGVGNKTVRAEAVSGTGTITITYTDHGLVSGDTIYVSNVTGTVPEGSYTVTYIGTNTFSISAPTFSATALDFQGVTDGTYRIFRTLSGSGSLSVDLRETAQGLAKAINRDTAAPTYGKYTSGLTETPGRVRIQAKGFDGTVYIRASSSAAGLAWSPVLPDSFLSGDQVFSRADSLPHAIYVSKIGEPEAVPVINFLTAGAKNKAICRIAALRDSVIIVKEDGVFRLSGDSTSNFQVVPLDTTVNCVSTSSVAVLNNQVVFLSNQGICLVTDSSVQIVSRKIEDVVQPILGSSVLDAQTVAVAYESERMYFVSTIEPQGSVASTVYVYNILNDTFVTSTQTFTAAQVGPSDILYLVSSNKILRERKNQNLTDYTGQNYTVTVTSVASDMLSAVITHGSYTPVVGDVIVKNNVFSKIISVIGASSPFTVGFNRATNLVAADTPNLFAKISSQVKLAPFHAGLVGRAKQYSQMQIHLRDNAISRCDISFTGQTFSGSETVTWQSGLVSAGWGSEPWGFFGWGQVEGTDFVYNTRPAPVVRIYVPRFQQRNTYIQPLVSHEMGGEALDIQAISFAVRAYNERVTT